MKFPVSVLPATVIFKEFFNHMCMLIIAFATLLLCGYTPQLFWVNLLYYMFAAFCFCEAIALILSVLTMLWRDVKKLVVSLTRMLMYFSPIIWDCKFSSNVPFHSILNKIMKANPLYYLVNGYRESIFYHKGFWQHPAQTALFWFVTLALFAAGSMLMYKFKKKLIDLI
jgi:teichoic acid transport system permease protein